MSQYNTHDSVMSQWAITKFIEETNKDLNQKYDTDQSYIFDALKILVTKTHGFLKFKKYIETDSEYNYYLISSEYNRVTSELDEDIENITNETRSILLKEYSGTLSLVSYTYLPIREVYSVLPTYDCDFTESYEGPTVHITYNDIESKWFIMTTSCFDIYKSQYANELTHGQMFDQCFKDQLTKDNFLADLNPDHSYVFVMVHHKNKYLVDYTTKFGEGYTKLILITVRGSYDLVEYDINDYYDLTTKYDNLFIDTTRHNIDDVNKIINDTYTGSYLTCEGFVFRDTNSEYKNLCKIRTKGYNEALSKIPYFNDKRWNLVYAYLANNLDEVLRFRGEVVTQDESKVIVHRVSNVIFGLVNILNYMIIQFTKVNFLVQRERGENNNVYEKRNETKYERLFENENFKAYKFFISKFQKFMSIYLRDSNTNDRKLFLNELTHHVTRTLRRCDIEGIMKMIDNYELLANKIREIFTDPRYAFRNSHEKYVIDFK